MNPHLMPHMSGRDAIVMPDCEKLFEYRENRYLVATVIGSIMWFKDYLHSFDVSFCEKYKIFLDGTNFKSDADRR